MLLSFARLNDSPPPERELLDVDDDGSFRAWRSIGPVVGRFAGQVPDLDAVRALAEAAAADPAPSRTEVPPHASIEQLTVGEQTATVGIRDRPDGPWGELLRTCRRLLDAARDQPLAALTLDVLGVDRVRLRHLGSEALPVELDFARAELKLWREGEVVAATAAEELGLGRVEAGPGWSIDIALPGFEDREGLLSASVSLVADDDGVYVPVVVAPPPISV